MAIVIFCREKIILQKLRMIKKILGIYGFTELQGQRLESWYSFYFCFIFLFSIFFPLEILQDQEFCRWLADPVKAALRS